MMRHLFPISAVLIATVAVAAPPAATPPPDRAPEPASADAAVPAEARVAPATRTRAEAVFAAGCFWCIEADFEKLDGVTAAISGYTGGHVPSPTYPAVTAGGTGHTEAVKVVYDPRKVTYEALVEYFWRHVDPFDGDGQFCDRGESYRPGIFPATAEERAIAERSKAAIAKRFGRPSPVEITTVGAFWPAEDYHQDYYVKNPIRYQYYRWGCGRDARVKAVWGDGG